MDVTTKKWKVDSTEVRPNAEGILNVKTLKEVETREAM